MVGRRIPIGIVQNSDSLDSETVSECDRILDDEYFQNIDPRDTHRNAIIERWRHLITGIARIGMTIPEGTVRARRLDELCDLVCFGFRKLENDPRLPSKPNAKVPLDFAWRLLDMADRCAGNVKEILGLSLCNADNLRSRLDLPTLPADEGTRQARVYSFYCDTLKVLRIVRSHMMGTRYESGMNEIYTAVEDLYRREQQQRGAFSETSLCKRGDTIDTQKQAMLVREIRGFIEDTRDHLDLAA